jgi:H+-transporting ATPase
MVTGDHAAIGRQVAGQVGLGTEIRSAREIFGEDASRDPGEDEQTRRRVLDADGYSEVTPEHKFRIIKAFQSGDRIVGMTGDGVNDAPALKQADVGFAVASATDAARSASDLILTRPGLGVIIHAIEEARRIFERMTGYATFRITESTRVLLFISLSVLAFGSYPVTPIMIVLLAILNDIPIMAIAWDNARTPTRPVRWQMPRVLTIAGVLGVAGVGSSFLLYFLIQTYWSGWGLVVGSAEGAGKALDQTAQTMMFLKLLVAGHMTIFLTRQRRWMWSQPLPSLPLFIPLELTQIVGTIFAVYGVLMPPIGWANAGIVWGYAIVWIVLLDAVKVLTYKLLDRVHDSDTKPSSGGEAPAR